MRENTKSLMFLFRLLNNLALAALLLSTQRLAAVTYDAGPGQTCTATR